MRNQSLLVGKMTSEWILFDNTELVLKKEDGELERVPADEIWKKEHGDEASVLPSLSSVGISCSRKVYSLELRLVEAADGPFGQLVLFAHGATSGPVQLSPAHTSDHVIDNNVWHAIDQYSVEQITGCIHDAGIELNIALSLQQYIEVMRKFSGFEWFSCDIHPTAKDVSIAVSSNQVSSTPSSHFTGRLYEYQRIGSNWLDFMVKQGAGVILGDSMGLGKTIQVIKVICDLLEEKPDARVLVVCPSALMENWSREFDKFSAGISKEKHCGANRTGDHRRITSSVVFTTYDIVRLDQAVLTQIEWDLLVLDEAQAIKNPTTGRTTAVKRLPRRVGIAVTGTPFENHLTDVWSLIDFCEPGALGSLSSFSARYRDDIESAKDLGAFVAPLMLRRKLEDIPNDLPDLIPIFMPIDLEESEAREYEEKRQEYKSKGLALAAIQNLIVALSKPKSGGGISDLKYEYLETVTDEVFGYREKLLVFADKMPAIGEISRRYERMVPTFTLTGADPSDSRIEVVDKFSSVDGPALLIANPRVAGAGLNIVAANHVFHFSPQWNPAIIDQSDARAHRNGQTKPVTAYYPYYASTVEEYMWEKVRDKRYLSKEVVTGNKGQINPNEIAEALSFSPCSRKEKYV